MQRPNRLAWGSWIKAHRPTPAHWELPTGWTVVGLTFRHDVNPQMIDPIGATDLMVTQTPKILTGAMDLIPADHAATFDRFKPENQRIKARVRRSPGHFIKSIKFIYTYLT